MRPSAVRFDHFTSGADNPPAWWCRGGPQRRGKSKKTCRSNRVPTHGVLLPRRIPDGHVKHLPVPTSPPDSLSQAGPADPLTVGSLLQSRERHCIFLVKVVASGTPARRLAARTARVWEPGLHFKTAWAHEFQACPRGRGTSTLPSAGPFPALQIGFPRRNRRCLGRSVLARTMTRLQRRRHIGAFAGGSTNTATIRRARPTRPCSHESRAGPCSDGQPIS